MAPVGLSRQLARHIAGATYAGLPAAAVTATKASLRDAIGVMLAASGLGEGCQAFADIARGSGAGPATILGYGDRVSPAMAAFANGAMAHALDYEDAYDGAPVHPNAATIPAALAIAEATNASGQALVTAIAVGCDLVCRLGLSLNKDISLAGWYPPPILGAFGAAAAGCSLLGLDEDAVLDALSLTLCQATCSAEIKYSAHSHIRAVRDAFPAQAGLLSAELAARGVKGFEEPLEGRAGFFHLYAQGAFDPDCLLRDLGKTYEGAQISFKLWPSCRGTHAHIEAALKILREQKLSWRDIDRVHMTISPVQRMLWEPTAQKLTPVTAIDAKFSIPFTVATAFVHGKVGLECFGPAALTDEQVLNFARRMTFEVDEGLSMTAGAMEVVAKDQSRFAVQVPHPLGHPSNPASDAALREKFIACAAHCAQPMSRQESLRLSATIDDLDKPNVAVASILEALR